MRAFVALLLVVAVAAQSGEYGGAAEYGGVAAAAPKCCPGIPNDPCSPALPLCSAGHPNSPLGRIPNAPTCGCVALAVCPCRAVAASAPATAFPGSSVFVAHSPVLGANYGPSVAGSAFGSRPLHFAKVQGCQCLGLSNCPCRPTGNLVDPVPEYVKPEEKEMVVPHKREMVTPLQKAEFDPFNTPVGRKAPLRRLGCGCRRLVEAMVMSPTDCSCLTSTSIPVVFNAAPSSCCTVEPCTFQPRCPGTLQMAVVNGGLVRNDIVTNVVTTA